MLWGAGDDTLFADAYIGPRRRMKQNSRHTRDNDMRSYETYVEEYRRLRNAQKSLNSKLLDCLPRGARGNTVILSAARELGYYVKHNTIVFSSEAAMDRLYDFLIYEPNRDGKSVAQRFLEDRDKHDISPDEETVLRAAANSSTSLFKIVHADRVTKRVDLNDLLLERPVVSIYDINLAKTLQGKSNGLLFGRILVAGNIAFSSGATLLFTEGEESFLLKQCEQLHKIGNAALRSRRRVALFMKMERHSPIETRYE